MDVKIQELTDKIYSEGVQRGKEEAERIIAEAQARAEALESRAQAEAERIASEAKTKAEELRRNTERELQLYASQIIESTRSSLADAVTGAVVEDNVKAATIQPELMWRVIVEIVRGFNLERGVVIESAQASELSDYFASNAKDLLTAGVEIKQVAGKQAGFVVRPQDGSFKIQIGEAEFVELFKSFLRPRLVELLFGRKA